LTADCWKTGYDSQIKDFDIRVAKLESHLSVTTSPATTYPGETVTVHAYYKNDYGNMIYGECVAKMKENGMKIDEIGMTRVSNLYYSNNFFLPERTGTYTITVTCSDDQYETEVESVSFQTRKMQAELMLSYPKIFYYGQNVEIKADYTHNKAVIKGECIISFRGEDKQISYTGTGYSGKVRIPYVAGQHTLEVKCSSNRYETNEKKLFITPTERPTGIDVISPVKRIFYPTDKIQIKVSYKDSLTGESIAGAKCKLDGTMPLKEAGEYYETEVGSLKVGTSTFSIQCSKQFYQAGTAIFTVTVLRIPVNIKFVETKDEYRAGEEIKVKATVVDSSGNTPNVSCNARVDFYDLLFNNLLKSHTADLVPENGLQVLTVQNPGQPAKIMVTVTCSGDIYEERTERIEVKAKQLGKETEEGALLFLSIITVILFALILLIRKKLKII